MVSRARQKAYASGERDLTTRSLAKLLTPSPIPNLSFYDSNKRDNPYSLALEDLGPDRRMYTPDNKPKPPGSYTRGAIRIRAGYHPRSLNFLTPRLIGLCVKRRIRKEVIHALKKAGKGGQKKRKLNFWSKIGC